MVHKCTFILTKYSLSSAIESTPLCSLLGHRLFPRGPTRILSSLPFASQLVRAKCQSSDTEEQRHVAKAQARRLKDALQRRKVYEQQLHAQTDPDCCAEHAIATPGGEQRHTQTARLNCRSEVEQYKAREGHCLVARVGKPITGELAPVDPNRAQDNERRAEKDARD